jgi:hypothetical protein
MTKSPGVVLISCFLGLITIGVSKVSCLNNDDVLLDRNKPSIYLTFERRGQRTPRNPDESSEGIWLRLHNNTRWAISTYAGSGVSLSKTSFAPLLLFNKRQPGLLDGVEIDAGYYVDADLQSNISPPKLLRHDSLASEVWLPSGRTLIFSVPREHLGKYLSISVPFQYQWERRPDAKATKISLLSILEEDINPTHRVHFYYYQLQRQLQ